MSKTDVVSYATKAATDYHKWFAKWIVEEVGYDPETASSKRAAFLRGVSIATAARPAFMDSEFLEEMREKHGVNKRGPKRADEVDEDEEEEVRPPRRTAIKKATLAKKVTPKPKFAPVEDDEDDFEDVDEVDDEFEDDDFEDDDEFDSDDGDDFEEEEAPAPKRRTTAKAAKKAAPAKRAPAKAAPKKAATSRRTKPADDDDFIF